MEEKTKVLYFVDRMLRGGIQSLVIDWLSRFDKEKIQVDVLLLDDGNKYELEDELERLGAKVYKLKGVWIRKITDYIAYCKSLKAFFKEHNDYKIIHMHSSSKNFMVLYYAKKYGINIRIAHSHNMEFQSKNKLKILMGNIFKLPLRKLATHYFACSKIAGNWMFGKKNVNNGKVKIIHNAVDIKKFSFDIHARTKIRTSMNIDKNRIVYGHVGRFTNQKNHEFLIDVFNEILKINSDSLLMLIGVGILEEAIKEKVDKLGISSRVIFMEFRNDVNELMSAMDVFLLPSKHEGLPVVGVEAQACGLPCFMSNTITKEIAITPNIYFIELEKTAKEWANQILEHSLERKDNTNYIEESGYSINNTINVLEQIYLNS